MRSGTCQHRISLGTRPTRPELWRAYQPWSASLPGPPLLSAGPDTAGPASSPPESGCPSRAQCGSCSGPPRRSSSSPNTPSGTPPRRTSPERPRRASAPWQAWHSSLHPWPLHGMAARSRSTVRSCSCCAPPLPSAASQRTRSGTRRRRTCPGKPPRASAPGLACRPWSPPLLAAAPAPSGCCTPPPEQGGQSARAPPPRCCGRSRRTWRSARWALALCGASRRRAPGSSCRRTSRSTPSS
mmetsp:Transcript_55334/g.129073  ORF Transcript_55334/g.129073 Transcript_55334/m.129073 type:complete len:241 (-) Transcript_55334:366-1088(-)